MFSIPNLRAVFRRGPPNWGKKISIFDRYLVLTSITAGPSRVINISTVLCVVCLHSLCQFIHGLYITKSTDPGLPIFWSLLLVHFYTVSSGNIYISSESVCVFLLAFHSNYTSVQDITIYWLKIKVLSPFLHTPIWFKPLHGVLQGVST